MKLSELKVLSQFKVKCNSAYFRYPISLFELEMDCELIKSTESKTTIKYTISSEQYMDLDSKIVKDLSTFLLKDKKTFQLDGYVDLYTDDSVKFWSTEQ